MTQSKLSSCSKRRDDACIGLGGLSQIGMQGGVAAQRFAFALSAHAPHCHDVAVVGQLQGFVRMLLDQQDGQDIDEWDALGTQAAGAYEFDAMQALLRFTGPIIGAINGACVTGGLELALACDLLLAAPEARFADSHARVGLLPGWGGSVRLARAIGLRRAKELALSGRWLGAQEALQWGLVNHVCAAEDLLPKAQAMARDMLRGAPGILAYYKRLLDQGHAAVMADALKLERQASLDKNLGVRRDQIDERLPDVRRRAPQSKSE